MSRQAISILCFLLLSGHYGESFDISFSEITEMLRFGRETLTDVMESWELVRPRGPESIEYDFPFVRKMEKVLSNRIMEVSNKLDVYQQKMEQSIEILLHKLVKQLPNQQRLESSMRDFDRYIAQINDKYEVFKRYAMVPEAFEKYTLQEFAERSVSAQIGALPDVLREIHRLMVPSNSQMVDHSLITLLTNQIKEVTTQICSEYQSPQQLLYNLYTTVALTEIKGYAMAQFSYMLLRLYHNGTNFSEEMQILKDEYATRTTETLRAVKTAMAFAPQDLWRCDPEKHVLGETYTELKQLFQGYIVNEVDLNDKATCRETCGYYEYATIHGCYKNQQACHIHQRCNGKILHCQYIDSDMWVCPAEKGSGRRYEWVEYENGMILGQKGQCVKGTTKVDSWWRWLFWHCSYCFCYCDDHNISSDRYFSLHSAIADIENNKVITGVKLVKKNQIIHIQIQEGSLLSRGDINASTVAWKSVDDFTVLDSGVKNGIDYHTLVWEKRALDLHDLVVPEGYVLTGIRFRMIGSHLNLEIMATPFNFTTGKLISPSTMSYWPSNDVTNRNELKLENPDIPTRVELPSLPISSDNQYINFQPSDLKKDASQNTVPFLDIQTLETKPPSPLAGAGIFYKGRKGSGGFVAMKLITYNFIPHLQADLPPAPPLIGTKQ